MKILSTSVFVCCLFMAFAQSSELYFTEYPALSPDGQTMWFTYDGDLWSVPVKGGAASRVTALDGREVNADISPDGQWIAFSGSQYGNSDVYVMPVGGGPIRQLTYHQSEDLVSSWSQDGQYIYFRSNRYNWMSTYRVALKGGTPERLFPHFFNYVHNLVEHPDGSFFFNESWESSWMVHRKGYKGAFNPDIKSYDPKTKSYQEWTNWEGKDFAPAIDQNGQLYFLSDEWNGQYNLYTLEKGKKKRLTDFKTSSIMDFSLSRDGSTIAFKLDFQLYTYQTKGGKVSKVPIELATNYTLAQSKDYKVQGNITAFDVSDDNKKIVFVSRGELFVSDVKGKFVRQLQRGGVERVAEVYWMADNKTLLFNQTWQGFQNWYTLPADGSAAPTQLTQERQNNRNLSFNSDKTAAVYFSGREEVRLLDMNTKESQTLLRDELWSLYNDQPYFSPDDRYIVFTAYRNFERDIMVYDLEKKETRNLTQTGVTEASPFWSPDGKYLYFTTNRTKPSYPYGLQEPDLYRMALQATDEPFKSDKWEALFTEEAEEKEAEEKSKAEEEKDGTAEEKVSVVIESEGIMRRLEQIGPRFGSQYGGFIYQKDEKTHLLYVSNHDEGKFNVWQTILEPFEAPKTEKVNGAESEGWSIVEKKDQLYILLEGKIHTLDLGGNKVEALKLEHTFRRQLAPEFQQMFEEVSANLQENFYNETFHGIDWAATKERYAAFLPYVQSRSDLRRLLNDLLGELNTSHFGFYSSGDEEKTYYGNQSQSTGILFREGDPYVVARVVARSPAAYPEMDIRSGDRLTAVNGQSLDPQQNREFYFNAPSLDEEIHLTLERDGVSRLVKIHPVSYGMIVGLLYDEWQDDCQARVDEKGQNRIAYVHMKDMGGGELQSFLHDMVSEGQQREALILDLRYNTGGNVHNEVLQFLSQRPYLQWRYREGAYSPQPNFAPSGNPIVLLINEQSLSDAEMTAAGFKELGLGTIIGRESYRWIIFTSGKGLVDDSFYRLPSWGCYTLDGKNLEQTGVAPDIEVHNNFKHRLEGEDPQLDRAIQELLQQLK